MMKSLMTILFVGMLQTAGAHENLILENVASGICSADTVVQADEKQDSVIVVKSEYSDEKAKRSNYLDSLANISAPFVITDPRFVKRGETKYILQNRYMDVGKPFSNWLFDRMDVGVTSGYYRMAPRSDRKVEPGMPLGIYLKYNLNRLCAVRLNYTRTRYEVEGFGQEIEHNGLDVDFMYNLSSYLYGHNAKRVMSVSVVGGLGYVRTEFMGKKEKAYKAQGGLNLDFKLTPSSHLFVEPFLAVASDEIDHSLYSNAHRWDLMFGVKGGVGVNFNTKNDSLKNVNYNGNVFWEMGQGMTFFPSSDIGLTQSIGTDYTLSVGKWLDPCIGVRLSTSLKDFNWATYTTESRAYSGFIVIPEYETKVRTVMWGGRLELLLDVLNFFENYRKRRNPFFAWQLSFGGEFGFMWKHHLLEHQAEMNLKTTYVGVVAGSQFLIAPDNNTAVFVEPRMLLANYAIPYVNAPDYKKKFTDKLFSVNVGVRVSHPVKEDRPSEQPAFKPRTFVGVVAGSLRGQNLKKTKGDDKMQLSAGVIVGREFAPYVAAKLQVDYQSLGTTSMLQYAVNEGVMYEKPALFNENSTVINTKLSYMLNFSNLYQGYNPNRRLNVFLELGPSYVHILNKKYSLYSKEMAGGKNPTPVFEEEEKAKREEKGSIGLYGSVFCSLQLRNHLHFVLNPYGQILSKPVIYNGLSLKYNHDYLMGLNVGVTYSF